MNIEHLSVSREGVWQQCQQNYKYKYHLKLISEAPEPIYFQYGKMVHKIIEIYTLGRGKKDINQCIKAVVDGAVELEPGKIAKPLPHEYKIKLPEHLRAFMRLTRNVGVEGEVEWKFKYDLDPPNGRFLTGFIDRIIRKKDKIFLIDYKTTKPGPWRKDKTNISKDLQLQCYCRVVQKEFGMKAENIEAALYFLEGAELVSVKHSEDVLGSIDNRMLEVYKSIENKHPDTVMGNVGPHCVRCDFKKICPFYNASKNNPHLMLEKYF